MENRNPTFEEVQAFFNTEYAFLKKWIAVKEPDWNVLLDECRELEKKFPFRYCIDRIVSTINWIEKTYMERKDENGSDQV